ncbi:hypothetical protein [Wolbachia endosymbiont (group B) of Longitarsus flavicornis]|uniref:hypothetical protein n=1 Tax=Wolbachia endosymbiont (group B) of Longitarsus flavicornis TaxID=3066135 RepID=UPI003341C3B2
MSDDTKQSNLKIIDQIEVKHKPNNFEKMKGSSAQVSYIHRILDKVVKDLNETFVPQLDDKLAEDKTSLDNLKNDLKGETGRIDEIMKQVGNASEGLVKNLNDLKKKVNDLESNKSGDEDIDIDGTWETQYFQNIDTELITM